MWVKFVAYNIAEKDALEIFVDGESIVLKKYTPGCIFCDSMDDVTEFNGKNVCTNCRTSLSK